MKESPVIVSASRQGAAGAPREARRGAGRWRRRLARVIPVVLAAGALGSLLVVVDPRAVVESTARFDLALVLPLVLAAAAFYLLQGLRWHLLLRAVGVRERVRDSELINLAGQAVTAVMPLGDLTRALLAGAASGVEFGATAATVTVQELTFTLLLVGLAAPGLGRLHDGLAWMAAVVAGVAAIVAILTLPPAYRGVRGVAVATPGMRRFVPQVDSLQREVRHLLSRPRVLAGTAIDLARAMVATAGMLLVLRGLGIDTVGWWEAALVVAVAYVGGAVSLLPGGIGANEASVVGILALLGVNPAAAAAAALLQRLWLSGFATAAGLIALGIVRRRLHLGARAALSTLGVSLRGQAAPVSSSAPEEMGELVAA